MDTSVSLLERLADAATRSRAVRRRIGLRGADRLLARGAGYANWPGRIGTAATDGLFGDVPPLTVKGVAPCLCHENATSQWRNRRATRTGERMDSDGESAVLGSM